MKFKLLKSLEEELAVEQKKLKKQKRLGAWHLWFAWRPIMMDDGSGTFRWLEKIKRRGRLGTYEIWELTIPWWYWTYIPIELDANDYED